MMNFHCLVHTKLQLTTYIDLVSRHDYMKHAGAKVIYGCYGALMAVNLEMIEGTSIEVINVNKV